MIDRFLRETLGEEVTAHYEIIIADPVEVARRMKKMVKAVRRQRIEQQKRTKEALPDVIDEFTLDRCQ